MKLTHEQLKNLKPCSSQYEAAIKALGSDFTADAFEARAKGVSMSDVIWAASAMAKSDKAIDRKLRMWMADCAARVLHIYEKTESSTAPRNAIIAARQFANGEIDDAAWDAAWDAAGAAAGAAAWDAARAAAWDAARAAAGAAAWDAAWAAAWDAARAAAGEWQYTRLCEWLSDSEPQPVEIGDKQNA